MQMEISREKKYFLIFLLIHFLVFSLIGAIRLVLPTDTLEGIWWGGLFSFGNPKHPPLAGWITYFVYNLFAKTDIILYFLSQAFIVCGLFFTYKLAKFFLEEKQAILSVVVLEGCWIYSYITGYYGFNPDVVLLCTLPMVTYYFYRSMNFNKPYDWIMLGLTTGISFMGKYQTVLLLAGMFIWALVFNRKVFKNKLFYLSILIAFLIFLPHLVWLIKSDFVSFAYYGSKLETIDAISHIKEPLMFIFMQFALIAGSIFIFAVNKYFDKSQFSLNRNIDKNGWFLIILTLTPLVIHVIIALLSASNIRPQWGFVFWYLIGIILFYFIPWNITEKAFKNTIITAYIVMFIIFISFGTMLVLEKSYRSRYPVQAVLDDFEKMWEYKFHTPLKYIGGLIDFTYPITIYGKSHPINLMDTYNCANIWLNNDDLKKNGALILVKHEDELEDFVRLTCPYLDSDITIIPQEYKFKLVNALGKSRDYHMYYYFVSPQNK